MKLVISTKKMLHQKILSCWCTSAKQAVMQRLRDAEREILYTEFIDKEDDILTGVIDRVDHRYVYVNLGRIEAVLSEAKEVLTKIYSNERIKVYVNKVEQTTKGPQIYVSRSHPGLLKRLFEQEVPEIYDGTVIVKSVAREVVIVLRLVFILIIQISMR